MIEDLYTDVYQITSLMDQAKEVKNPLKFLKEKLVQKDEELFENGWKDKFQKIEKDLKNQKEKVIPKEMQAIYRQPAVLMNQLFQYFFLLGSYAFPTDG